jgi:hypothetical protein
MKQKWYANWLIIITLCLLFSSFGVFYLSIKNDISVTRCIYGDNLDHNCICNVNGEIICEDEEIEEGKVVSNDFVSSNLEFKYDFLNFIDLNTSIQDSVEFKDISHIQGGLKITIERISLCSEQQKAPSQLGLYKLEENGLILTTATNLTDSSFYISCITENTFFIPDFPTNLSEDFQVLYQDDLDVIYMANNCVYEGFLRNSGDVYNSKEKCIICKCISGENSCQKEESCLE